MGAVNLAEVTVNVQDGLGVVALFAAVVGVIVAATSFGVWVDEEHGDNVALLMGFLFTGLSFVAIFYAAALL